MAKNFILRILVIAVVLAAAVMWLLSIIPATAGVFGWFSLAWAVTMIAGALGVRYVLVGVFTHDNPVIKKCSILFGAVFLVVTLFCLTWAIAMPKDWIAPLVAVIITGALFLCVLLTGGRKWDTGDNQKVGYQNYYQRKAAEQKAAEHNDNH